MRKVILTFFILLACNTFAQEVNFVPNEGQWDGDFAYKMNLNSGALFFKPGGFQAVLLDPHAKDEAHGTHSHDLNIGHSPDIVSGHVLAMRYSGAHTVEPQGDAAQTYYHNYFLGNDSTRWRGKVPVYTELVYANMYDGATLRYLQNEIGLKYEWKLTKPQVLKQIRWSYDGANDMYVNQEGQLIIETAQGHMYESAPIAFYYKDGRAYPLPLEFVVSSGEASFAPKINMPVCDSIWIDPNLVFASYSGSTKDNWGFTATYDDAGRLYGGGITFGTGYLVSVGAFQTQYSSSGPGSFNFIPDVTITAFEPTGTTVLYATYLGGPDSDHPQSMVVNSNNELIVMGTTGSNNFPTKNAYQSTHGGGTQRNINNYQFARADIFVTRFKDDGTDIMSSTFVGGSANDGLNNVLDTNYGDAARGEVVVDAQNNIYVTTSTLSTDFPSANCSDCSKNGTQDAVMFKLNAAGSSLLWSNYMGGSGSEAGYSCKVSNGMVFMCGGTNSSDLSTTSGGFKSTAQGGWDGFVYKLNAGTGAIVQGTYVGTSAYDQTFLMDVDKNGAVYVFGQTTGAYPISNGVWSVPMYRKQFIHKINNGLTSGLLSTAFGSSSGGMNMVPTAFNVDDCLNILLSGWGGSTNGGAFTGTTVNGMPLSADAMKSTTNGSDFYFMVLEANMSALKYGSFFGGNNSSEHVDGGTSRFDERGRIYQAVCAGCGGMNDLPTTPTAYSPNNGSSNCNLGVIKLDFETSVVADADIDLNFAPDTNCLELTLKLGNNSINAHTYFWDLGQGDTSVQAEPFVTFPNIGTYDVMLVAIDTVCDTQDTAWLQIEHDSAAFPETDWTHSYTSCDLLRTVTFDRVIDQAQYYEWTFGDGATRTTTTQSQVVHQYNNTGTFLAQVEAKDSACPVSFTQQFNVEFDDNVALPEVEVTTDSCHYGGVDVTYRNIDSTMLFIWNFNGTLDSGMIPSFRYPKSGLETVLLTIYDTVCNRSYSFNFLTEIIRTEDRVWIPSAFTPDGNELNEEFVIYGNACLYNTEFWIYDRWGQELFYSNRPFNEFWDGTLNGKEVPGGVYTYRFTGGNVELNGTVTLIR